MNGAAPDAVERFQASDGERVFHTYSTYARGGEMIGGSHYILDLTAYGRQQEWEEADLRLSKPLRPAVLTARPNPTDAAPARRYPVLRP